MSTAAAARATTACPTGAAVAVLVVGYLYDHLNPPSRALTFTSLMIISIFPLYQLSLATERPPGVTQVVVLLFTFGAAMSPVKYLVCPTFCSVYGGEHFMGTLVSGEEGGGQGVLLLLPLLLPLLLLLAVTLDFETQQSSPLTSFSLLLSPPPPP